MNISAQRRGASSAQRDYAEFLNDRGEINLRMDDLVREYRKTPPCDPRRTEIANELSKLCLVLDRLRGPQK
jgi:hypothetical protein